MAHFDEGATGSVEAVRFSVLTREEVRKQSFVKITDPNLLNNVGQPIPGGPYDPALGPLQERTPCKSCGQSSFNCPGHCGHIELVSPVYNPVLFSTLCSLLRKTCLFCHHLNAGPSEVKKCVSKLELIAKGDVARVRDLDDGLSSESSDEEDNAGSKYHGSKHLKQQKWTSLQFTEAMSVWKNLPRPKRYEGCGYCGEDIVKIRSPTFGWICKVKKNENTADTKEFGLQGAPADEELLHEERIIKNVRATSTQIRDSKRDKGLGQNLKEREPVSLVPLLPSEVKEIVRLLWENEAQLLTCISDIQRQGFGEKADHLMFFLETLLVPPIKFRPPSKGGDSVMEHPHTFLLSKVLQANIDLGNAHINKLESSKIIQRWMDLQQCINVMFDSKKAAGKRNVPPGICQLLEKKEGLFRQKMMGKRVNFSCRSVISPDPYLAVNEIGIPPHFALRLTYPERVTPWNAVKLRDAIVNGPEVHPGATHYIDKSTTVKLPLSRKARISISRKLLSSRGVVIQDGNNIDHEFEGKIVYRHLQDGDMVLVNRQPTLHKPSIMAHVVRVLKGEKTIRMHYANCSTYNADFDGDEMNVHFPQDEISRAEGYTILNANNQYLKPTSGEPIRALIQDHIVSAVLLTKKDTFLRWDEFNQLLYSTGLSSPGSGASSTEFGTKVFESGCEAEFQSLLPAIWKPEPLWTGKQVITALLNHITRGFLPFTVEKGGRIPRDFFNTKRVENEPSRDADKDELRMMEELDEDKLLVYRNNIVRGVIDKAQFGEYGLVHMVQELYGSNAAGLLLSAFSRLFTAFLQMHGFTCGVDDLLLVESKDRERKRQLEKCEEIGEEVHRRFVGIEDDETIDPCTLQLKIEKDICTNGEAALASLDRKMISRLNDITSKSEELEGLLSDGLLKPPSKNCISLMTTSGAKGGVVNFQQISSHLGQQELEGKRVPRMVSGKTLPCFPPWDWASRSGGLVVDRFLSGLRPQEFYFHCMAGREGLVDTAVKTSRSGYLQRCLVKNLESLKVNYDHTVRDADGSIVQFLYGEDGVDVHQTSFLSKLETLAKNEEMITKNCCRQVDKSNPYIEDLPSALKKKAVEFVDKLSSKQNRSGSHQGDFLKLVEHKYLSSLAQPGESVGVLAAQSVGEPSTQMTLNTFHLAGRGEANVTLGIPRLQEILMRASTNIKTPIMTCPLQEGKSEEDAKNVAFKLSKITVADIIESMQVTVEPFSCTNGISRAYKLEMKIYDWISSKDWENTLLRKFEKQLRSAVKKHLKLIRRVNGIKHFLLISQSKDCKEGDDDFSSSGEESEDLGLDAQKRKQQVTDEMDYGDYSEEEVDEENPSAGFGGENDKGKNVKEFSEDDENEILDAKDGQLESPLEVGGFSKSKSPEKKIQSRSKETTLDGFNFTVHFTFPTHEPHIMLAQIAQDTAKKVYIEQYGGINYCRNITCKENQVFYYGKDPKCKEDIPLIEKEKIPALQTSGVDIATFCELQDILDVRYIYSNDIHAILHTYGVEAARETIIREITNVFKSYGISVDIRHLTLIADFMTRTGRYRPMSRFGGVAESISPFSKMSFETATKFIVEAAFHREMDDLESPSARICLGLPVKVGTGCFDLMHKMEV